MYCRLCIYHGTFFIGQIMYSSAVSTNIMNEISCGSEEDFSISQKRDIAKKTKTQEKYNLSS